MTTYILDGFAIYFSNLVGGDVGAKFSGISLEIVAPESTTSFDYSLLPLSPGDKFPDDQYVDTNIDDYTVRLNGNTVGPGFEFGEGIFNVGWTDTGGATHTTTIFIADRLDVNVPGFGFVDPQNVFVIGGDALPSFSTFAEFTNFDANQITSFTVPTGAFGPGKTIQLADIGATVTQSDIITGTGGADVFLGGIGADDISGRGGDDTLFGGRGRDTLNGNGGKDKLFGQVGNDVLGGGAGRDKLFGGTGKDKLFGDGGDDVLNGGRGNDVLNGGRGNDVLNGGPGGADDFVFQNNSGNDIITDFNATNNKEDINLRAVTGITGFKDLKNNYMSQAGSDVIIDDGAGTEITLLNVALSDLGKGDFIF